METELNPSSTESIKLIKNSRGYTWEVKVFPNYSLEFANIEERDAEWLKRLKSIDESMQRLWGVQNEVALQ